MDQPALGKRIVVLRKAKGLTQEELVEKCNLNVRTLQRIESGEVTPRSYTRRLIFAALDSNINDSFEIAHDKSAKIGFIIPVWLEQFYRYVFDLFNLKTNKMKKISILSVTICALGFMLMILFTESKAQSQAKVKKTIEECSKNSIRWFNNGQIDSLMTLYRGDACLGARGCGKIFINEYYETGSKTFKLKEFNIHDISVSDSIAVEKGRLLISLNSGEELEGEFLTEWRRTNKKWLIVNDLASVKEK